MIWLSYVALQNKEYGVWHYEILQSNILFSVETQPTSMGPSILLGIEADVNYIWPSSLWWKLCV